MIVYCRRCGCDREGIYPTKGQGWPRPRCVHQGENVGITEDRERALRTRARYELGKRFNPDHDTTDYYAEEVGFTLSD